MTDIEFKEKGTALFKNFEKSEKFEDNYQHIPVSALSFNEENVVLFNKIASWLYASGFFVIKRTKSGGISTTKKNLIDPCYDIRERGVGLEITIVSRVYGCMRIQWRNSSKDLFNEGKMSINGKLAFIKFKSLCKDYGIDLDDYAERDKEKAKLNKESIEDAKICFASEEIENKFLNNGKPITIKNMFHIDFHSSYMSGLVNTHPEFKEVVNYIYEKRKEKNTYYKAILNMTQGFMQSDLCGLKWAHLSKDMISDNNRRIENLTKKLENNGFVPILYNTDGIWYYSPNGVPYHGEGEGKGIGKWENDHLDCKFRAKSKGAYEFMENGEYHAVVRGLTKYDIINPDRTKWQWGDILRSEAEVINFRFRKGFLYMGDIVEGVEYYE